MYMRLVQPVAVSHEKDTLYMPKGHAFEITFHIPLELKRSSRALLSPSYTASGLTQGMREGGPSLPYHQGELRSWPLCDQRMGWHGSVDPGLNHHKLCTPVTHPTTSGKVKDGGGSQRQRETRCARTRRSMRTHRWCDT